MRLKTTVRIVALLLFLLFGSLPAKAEDCLSTHWTCLYTCWATPGFTWRCAQLCHWEQTEYCQSVCNLTIIGSGPDTGTWTYTCDYDVQIW